MVTKTIYKREELVNIQKLGNEKDKYLAFDEDDIICLYKYIGENQYEKLGWYENDDTRRKYYTFGWDYPKKGDVFKYNLTDSNNFYIIIGIGLTKLDKDWVPTVTYQNEIGDIFTRTSCSFAENFSKVNNVL